MKLLLLDQFSDLGGGQQVLLELLPAIRRRGWQAVVGIPGAGPLFDRVREQGFEAHQIDCGPYRSGSKSPADVWRFVKGCPRLARQIEQLARDADLLYLNGPRVVPAAARADLRLPTVFHAHSYLPNLAIRTLTGYCVRGMRARVLGCCRFVADPWREYVGDARVSVLYNGVSGRMPSCRRLLIAAAPRIGCIGRIAPEKGQREFIKAARIIHRAIPDSRFVIYGAPLFADPTAVIYESEVRAAASGLAVEFAGWTPDVYAALSEMSLLLVPSVGPEATTRVILEAFAAGVPVIAFRSGGIPEVVEHGVNGLLADSVEEIARMAIGLLRDPSRASSTAEAARETWQRRFTLEGFQQQWAEWVAASAR